MTGKIHPPPLISHLSKVKEEQLLVAEIGQPRQSVGFSLLFVFPFFIRLHGENINIINTALKRILGKIHTTCNTFDLKKIIYSVSFLKPAIISYILSLRLYTIQLKNKNGGFCFGEIEILTIWIRK